MGKAPRSGRNKIDPKSCADTERPGWPTRGIPEQEAIDRSQGGQITEGGVRTSAEKKCRAAAAGRTHVRVRVSARWGGQ